MINAFLLTDELAPISFLGYDLEGNAVIGFKTTKRIPESELVRLADILKTEYVGDESQLSTYDLIDENPRDDELKAFFGIDFDDLSVIDLYLPEDDHPYVSEYIDCVYSMMPDFPIEYQRLLALLYASTCFAADMYVFVNRRTTPLNIYAMILGSTSTTGKTTSVATMDKLVRMTFDKAVDVYPRISADFTPEGLNKLLMRIPNGIAWMVRDEADGFFNRVLGASYMKGTVEALTNYYLDDVIRRTARSTTSKRDMEKDKNQVSLNCLFMGTPDALLSTLRRSQFDTGFLHRFLFAFGEAPSTDLMFTEIEDMVPLEAMKATEQFNKLTDKMAALKMQWREARTYSSFEVTDGKVPIRMTPKAQEVCNEVALELHRSLDEQYTHAAFERFKLNVIKISGILAAASGEVMIDERIARYGLKYAYGYYRTIIDVYETIS